MKKFSIIYADPPWKHKDANRNGNRGAVNKYPCMDLGQLFAMRPMIDQWAAPDCLLALWWLGSMPAEALDLVKVWGFSLWNMNGLIWHKETKHGKEHFGLGRTTRPSTEICLFARRGRVERIDKGVRQVFVAKTGVHSQKPNEARLRLVRLFGDKPRIELFARETVDGWSAFGNQVGILNNENESLKP